MPEIFTKKIEQDSNKPILLNGLNLLSNTEIRPQIEFLCSREGDHENDCSKDDLLEAK